MIKLLVVANPYIMPGCVDLVGMGREQLYQVLDGTPAGSVLECTIITPEESSARDIIRKNNEDSALYCDPRGPNRRRHYLYTNEYLRCVRGICELGGKEAQTALALFEQDVLFSMQEEFGDAVGLVFAYVTNYYEDFWSKSFVVEVECGLFDDVCEGDRVVQMQTKSWVGSSSVWPRNTLYGELHQPYGRRACAGATGPSVPTSMEDVLNAHG